jgi:hypothetical protein
MTNTAPTSDAIAWQRLGRVTGVAGLAAVVLILVPIVVGTRPEPTFDATAIEFLTYYQSPHTPATQFRSFVLTIGLITFVGFVGALTTAADQPALAAQAARLGAGIHLHEESATATAIASAIRTVLDDSTYAANARALSNRIRSYRNQPRAVVERILGHASSGQLTATGDGSSSQSTDHQIDWSK